MTPTLTQMTYQPQTTSSQNCPLNSQYLTYFLVGEPECGISPLNGDHEFITGPAHDPEYNPAGEWPWMASLGYWAEDGKWDHQCGATLISHHHFLTAAHCLKQLDDR